MDGPAHVDSLRAAWRSGARPTFYYFWGHRAREAGRLGKWCLSQWWPVTFAVDGSVYPSAEHFMMAEKARLFGDNATVARILATTDPAEAKKIGRTVRGFDDNVWKAQRYDRAPGRQAALLRWKGQVSIGGDRGVEQGDEADEAKRIGASQLIPGVGPTVA